MAFSVSSAFCAQPSPDPIIIGYPSPALTELPNYLAVNKGFYTAEGLEAKFVRARSTVRSRARLRNAAQRLRTSRDRIGRPGGRFTLFSRLIRRRVYGRPLLWPP